MNTLRVRTRLAREPDDGRDYLLPELLVDGHPLLDFQRRNLGLDLRQLAESTRRDGEFFIVTCACGDAACAGIRRGFTVRRDAKNVLWVVRGVGPTRTLAFGREPYLQAVEQGILELRRLKQRHACRIVPSTNDSLLEAS